MFKHLSPQPALSEIFSSCISMRNTRLIVLLATLFCLSQGALAQEDNREAYAVLDANGLLKFYYDTNKPDASESIKVYDIPWNSGDPEDWNDPGWVHYDEENYEYIENTDITTVDFDISFREYNLESAFDMFATCTALTSINFTNFNTSNVRNMAYMFYNCSALTDIDLSTFDTNQVENMEAMFAECSALTSITFGNNFNTENITNMGGMFANCYSLTSLDLSNFNTEKVTSMAGMFNECEELAALNLSNFNTSNVTNMSYMFYGCTNLTTIYCNDDWSSIERDEEVSSIEMFYHCTSLPNYQDNEYDITCAKPVSMGGYFTSSGPLAYAVLTSDGNLTFYYDENSAERANDQNTVKIFYNFVWDDEEQSYTQITTATFDASFSDYPITSTASMFERLQYLTTINGLEYLNTSNVTNMSYMFNLCYSLQTLDLSNFETSNVTDMSYMFNECSSLTTIYCNDDWDQPNILNSDKIFFSCVNLPNYSDVDITKANPTTTGYFTYGLRDYAENSNLLDRIDDMPRVGLVGRTLYKDGDWNTLCLPFNVGNEGNGLTGTPLEGATVMTLDNSENSETGFDPSSGTLTLNFAEVNSIEAGKPYIIKWENSGENIVNPTFTNVTIYDAPEDERIIWTDDVSFIGTYDPQPLTSANTNILYLGAGNTLYYTSASMTINAFRAYFELNLTSSQQVKAINLNFGDEENGIFLMEDGRSKMEDAYFSLDGRRLLDKPTQRGMYIHNGRKVLIK